MLSYFFQFFQGVNHEHVKVRKVRLNAENSGLWAAEWLDGVADGVSTMSQRKLSSVETRGGGLEAVKALARLRGVHLLLLEDDGGSELAVFSSPLSRLRPLLTELRQRGGGRGRGWGA